MNNQTQFAELTTAQLGNRDTVRQNTQRGEEVVKIAIDKIQIREGFNVRQDYGDLESLALSILENGQIIPGRVDVLNDGTFLLTDGHRRYKALCLLVDMGHDEPMFKAIVNTTKTTEEQRILQMFTTQDNKQLAPHEIAELIKRLINLGYNQISVAKKIGKTEGYISQMLSFANESPIIKEHVKNGNINVSTVVKLQKDIPIQSERIEAVNKAVTIKKDISKKEKVAPVSVKEVTGETKKHTDIKEKLANKIIEVFDMPQNCKLQLLNIIKSYL